MDFSKTKIMGIQKKFMGCGAMLVSVNFGCFAPSICERYHCNAMTKAIKAP